MVGEIEAAGELVTGGLLGRAVEPHAGEGHGHGATMCLNCGTALVGPHCHSCGQSGHVHRSLSGIGHDLIHGVFHFDGKFFRTLPLLVWRPGELTRRYVQGERARFVSPMALFLFSIFAMFAVFSWAGISAPTDLEGGGATQSIAQIRSSLTEQRADLAESVGEREAGDPKRLRDQRRISEIDQALAALPKAEAEKGGHNNVHVTTRFTGWALLDHGVEKWNKNPSLMLYKLQSSVYKFSWLLIPLSLPFLWLLFCWKREYRLYDHAVFIIYSISFMSLLFIAMTVAGSLGLGVGWLIAAGLLVPLVHLARQLKQAYVLGWPSAIARTVVLSFFITIILQVFAVVLVLMGMLG